LSTILSASCGPPADDGPVGSAATTQPRGGTLRLAVPFDPIVPSALQLPAPDGANALDPHRWTWYDDLELQRCCLSRTLVSYLGVPTSEGGSILQPDLAESLPEVSADGLLWTFRIRPGIRYAPPLEDVEVTSLDFVRGLHRILPFHVGDQGGFAALTQLGIVGVDAYLAGTASTVAGLETPDPYTLRIRVERPVSYLPARFALSDTAPIPPSPLDPAAPLGLATGHDDDYGRFAPATGPYTIEGADQIDFSLPAEQQVPGSGFVPGVSLTLVRNPSWDPATDLLRPAYVDRIEISIGGTLAAASARVDAGELDFVHFAGPPPQAPLDQIERYNADPSLGQVHVHSRDIIRFLEMNLALPPLDDIHVRKALNLVMDKAALIELAGGPQVAAPAGHLVLDSLEGNLLLAYDPYRTVGSGGDAAAAREEMRQSAYDADGDGRCDDPVCEAVHMLTFRMTPEQADVVVTGFAEVGIGVVVEPTPFSEAHARWYDPSERIGLFAGAPFAKDMLDAGPFFRSVFDSRYSASDELTNGNMVGTSREQLERWGYGPADLPSVDDRIDACLADTGGRQVQCWASLDQYLMENVVPWAPLFVERYTRTVSSRVAHYSFAQLSAQPALDQIAVRP
jgi:peptide/nickel transport system substrate-binding protein